LYTDLHKTWHVDNGYLYNIFHEIIVLGSALQLRAQFFLLKIPDAPNLTKFKMIMGTTAAHKHSKFQEYTLRESPLQGEKVEKRSNFGVIFGDRNPEYEHTDSNQCIGLPLHFCSVL